MASRLRPILARCDRVAGYLQNHGSIQGFVSRNRRFKVIFLGSASFSSSSFLVPFRSLGCSVSRGHRHGATVLSSSALLPFKPPSPHPLSSQRIDYSSGVTPIDISSPVDKEILVERFAQLPVLSVPMPSRLENCRFTLRPLANTLADFISFLKDEDPAIGHVSAHTQDGEVIPGLTTIDILLKSNFYLQINDQRYLVRPPEEGVVASAEKLEDLSSVKDTVARLFRALHSDQFHTMQQRHLLARLEEIKVQLEPLEKMRQDLHERATKRNRMLSWVGLGLMGLQFGFLARLTWWEYSWDIMEPVTYFVTYGTAMAMFAYHLLTLQDYSYPDAYDREIVMTVHRLAGKTAFDIAKYNRLRSEKAQLELDLERLRNPLQIKVNPPYLPPSASSSSANDVICKA